MLDSRTAILSAIFLTTATGFAHCADLRWERYLDPDWRPRVRRVYPPEPTQPVYRYTPPERPAIKKGDRLPLSSSSRDSEGGVTVKPRDARPLVTAPASGKATEDHSYLIPLLLVILAMIGVLWIISSLPRLARGIDGLFEPSTGEATGEEPVFVHLTDPPPVDARPPNHQDEMATMRAMKEQLEAQAAAARAAIEEALARNKDQKEDAA